MERRALWDPQEPRAQNWVLSASRASHPPSRQTLARAHSEEAVVVVVGRTNVKAHRSPVLEEAAEALVVAAVPGDTVDREVA